MPLLCSPFLLLAFLVGDTPKPVAEKDGNIDYEKALNERLSKGITPERNANVLLWKAFGPTPRGGAGMPGAYFKWLGIEEPRKEGDYFISSTAYIRDHLKLDEDGRHKFIDRQGPTSQRPWKATAYPQQAGWLEANEKPLAIVVEATKRPDYFNPLVTHDKEPGRLPAAFAPGMSVALACKEFASAFVARAMLREGEEKFDEAWQDLLACQRLGRLVTRGGTIVEELVGCVIIQIGSRATLAYLARAHLTSAQLRDQLKELQSHPEISPVADKVDLFERYVFQDTIDFIRPTKNAKWALKDALKEDGDLTPEQQKLWAAIDWQPVIANGNLWYDRIVAALRLKTRMEREKELESINKRLQNLDKGFPEAVLKDPIDQKAVIRYGNTLLVHLPAVRNVQNAADRAEQAQRNLYVTFALAAYRRDNGKYPAKLETLSPKYLPAIPRDLFSGKELIYRTEDRGYLLYSVGVNGKDDGGRWVDDDPPGDDLGVRMPLPALKPLK